METDTPDRLAWGKMALIRDYVVSLAGAMADAPLPCRPWTRRPRRFAISSRRSGRCGPMVLAQLGMSALKTRADLQRLAVGLQALGV